MNGGPDGAPATAPPGTVLVLGGGGLKGIAHIGVLRALEESGVRVDAIVGTSIGALIGALRAAGESVDGLAERARELRENDILRVNYRIAWIRGVRQQSLYTGERLRDYIGAALPVGSFDELATPLRVNAVSLGTGRSVWFGTGTRTDLPLADAVYASSALPVYFPPLHANGDFLVDGGVLDSLPVRAALDWDAERVIAVDVSASFKAAAPDPWVEHGLVGIHQRVMDIVGEKERRMIPSPDLSRVVLVRPEIGHLGTFEFGHAEFAMERGYAATLAALETAEADEAAAADGRVRRIWTRVRDAVRDVVPAGMSREQAADGRDASGSTTD